MNKLLRLVISAIAFAAPVVADATPVTWSFFETGILSCNGGPRGCVLPPQPFILMTLALPGPTSAGTATLRGTGTLPVYTGDSFALATFTPLPLTPAFA